MHLRLYTKLVTAACSRAVTLTRHVCMCFSQMGTWWGPKNPTFWRHCCSLPRKRTTKGNPDSSKRQQPFSLSRKHFLGCLRLACEPPECFFMAQHPAYIGSSVAFHSGPSVAGGRCDACAPWWRLNLGYGAPSLAV